ncbi:hypothetical protein ACWGTO_27400 [Mesorhizobium sp. PL10]
MQYPPIDGFWTWVIKRNRVYGDANLSDHLGLTLDEFSHDASIERCMQSVGAEDRLRVHEAQIGLEQTLLACAGNLAEAAEFSRHHAGKMALRRAALQQGGALKSSVAVKLDQHSRGAGGVAPELAKIVPVPIGRYAAGNDVQHGLQLVGETALVFVHRRGPIGGAKYRHFCKKRNRFVDRALIQPDTAPP